MVTQKYGLTKGLRKDPFFIMRARHVLRYHLVVPWRRQRKESNEPIPELHVALQLQDGDVVVEGPSTVVGVSYDLTHYTFRQNLRLFLCLSVCFFSLSNVLFESSSTAL